MFSLRDNSYAFFFDLLGFSLVLEKM